MELNERKLKILHAIIQDYIDTAEPVGSRTLAKKYSLGVSPATIRNEMADLEELGYLTQPHTSAGRIPSDKGYRLYVDDLMELKMVAEIQREHIRNNLLKRFGEMEQLLQYSSKVLSELTSYTSVALAPQIKESRLKLISLVPIDTENIITIIITDTGVVRKPVFKIPGEMDYSNIQTVSNLLNDKLQGVSIKDIESRLAKVLNREFAQFNSIIQKILPELIKTLEETDDIELFSNGTTNIFNFPEFNDLLKAKSFLALLEEKQKMSNLITSTGLGKDELTISIGSENNYQEARDCSLVTATCKVDGNIVGWLSVIGPTRMDYAKVASVVNQVTKYVNELLKTKYR